jgi:hypothetical protein
VSDTPTQIPTRDLPVPPTPEPAATETASEPERGRVKRMQDRLSRRADTRLGRLALLWFRAYFEASRNSGCAASIYSAFSILPAALATIAFFDLSRGDSNALADRLISHLKLDDTTAAIVRDTFGTASSNALAATITVVFGFLLWGLGIGQIYQDFLARAWRIKVGSLADQGLFAVFFFVVTGAVALSVVSAERLRETGWFAVLPVWLVGSTVFWLWVPWFLLHRKIGLRALLPGALLASVVLGGTAATSPLFLADSLNAGGRAFGSFGVVITVIGAVFVMITISLVCAVFSPVWASWREGERLRALEKSRLRA